jgi:hypothetical protein
LSAVELDVVVRPSDMAGNRRPDTKEPLHPRGQPTWLASHSAWPRRYILGGSDVDGKATERAKNHPKLFCPATSTPASGSMMSCCSPTNVIVAKGNERHSLRIASLPIRREYRFLDTPQLPLGRDLT